MQRNRLSRTLAALGALALGASLVASPAAAAPKDQGNAKPFTVMARNLYLGADVNGAIALLPDVPAAAQYMWDQVAATDFGARAPKLAAEIARERPAVIGVQEATQWICKKNVVSDPVDVYNFTEDLLDATAAAGVPYVVASAGGEQAFNPGYTIPPISGLTTVYDPETFLPLFGTTEADCGFTISDALLVRADLAGGVLAVGTVEYDDAIEIPLVAGIALRIDRGYAWADVRVQGNKIRFVATHLESMWIDDVVTFSAQQARQLVADLSAVKMPLVVIGDFNNDPRDPRPVGAPNPGGQPVASDACPAQVPNPTVATAKSECNSYWVMRQAGFAQAGPDVFDPANYTWGSMAELAGPDAARIDTALAMGNSYGFTDRLDYVFVKNGAKSKSAKIIGNVWPYASDNWACNTTQTQIGNTEAMSQRLVEAGVIGAPVTGSGVCLPTDHAGIVAQLRVVPGQAKK